MFFGQCRLCRTQTLFRGSLRGVDKGKKLLQEFGSSDIDLKFPDCRYLLTKLAACGPFYRAGSDFHKCMKKVKDSLYQYNEQEYGYIIARLVDIKAAGVLGHTLLEFEKKEMHNASPHTSIEIISALAQLQPKGDWEMLISLLIDKLSGNLPNLKPKLLYLLVYGIAKLRLETNKKAVHLVEHEAVPLFIDYITQPAPPDAKNWNQGDILGCHYILRVCWACARLGIENEALYGHVAVCLSTQMDRLAHRELTALCQVYSVVAPDKRYAIELVTRATDELEILNRGGDPAVSEISQPRKKLFPKKNRKLTLLDAVEEAKTPKLKKRKNIRFNENATNLAVNLMKNM
eukprot:Platyproteum_vivax@DN3896_c0_g1_i1.p1